MDESFTIQSNRSSELTCSLERLTSLGELVGKDQGIRQPGVCGTVVNFATGSFAVTGHGSHRGLYHTDICQKDNTGEYKQCLGRTKVYF